MDIWCRIWCRYHQMQKSIFKSDNDEDCDVWCVLFWVLLQSFEFEYLNTNMNMIKDRRCYCDIWGKYLISNTNIKKHGKDFDFDFDADYFEWGCRVWRNISSQYMKNTTNRNTNTDKKWQCRGLWFWCGLFRVLLQSLKK